MGLLVLFKRYLLILPIPVVLRLYEMIKGGLGVGMLWGDAAGERNLGVLVDDVGLRHLGR